ncbi:MAG: hypothetical protein AB1405_05895 [Bdellovibrionota bacterium]
MAPPTISDETDPALIQLIGGNLLVKTLSSKDREILRKAREALERKANVHYEFHCLRADPRTAGFDDPKRRWTDYVRWEGPFAAMLVTTTPQEGTSHLSLLLLDETRGELLTEADLTNSVFGGRLYGPKDIQWLKLGDRDYVLMTSTNFGGDGDHTIYYMNLFRWNTKKIDPLLQNANLYNSVLKAGESGKFSVTGKEIYTFCISCDGWEADAPEDIFELPTTFTWDGERLQNEIEINDAERKDFLERVDTGLTARKNESWRSESDIRNIEAIAAQIRSRLVDTKNR